MIRSDVGLVLSSSNGSGMLVWKLALAGMSEADIAATLAQRHAINVDVAIKHVRDALSMSLADGPPAPPTDFNYAREGNQYIFKFRGEAVLAVDERGERITLLGIPDGISLLYLLQAIAPKLLALRGEVVLHASAVAVRGHVIAFSGFSGAGKTSTARASRRAGAQLICEDKLIVRPLDDGPIVARLGDAPSSSGSRRPPRRWTGRRRELFDLDLGLNGDMMPLAEIGFLDAEQQDVRVLRFAALSETETAGAVFRHGFYGSDANQDWIRHLRTAAHIAQTEAASR